MIFENLNLEDLLLDKNEIRIIRTGSFMDGAVALPVHRILLSKHIELDPHLPYKVFEESCRKVSKDLEEEIKVSIDEKDKKFLSSFIGEPKFGQEMGRPAMVKPYGVWPHSYPIRGGNGLAQTLQMTGHTSLGISYPIEFMPAFDANFSEEKFKVYGEVVRYTPANTDSLIHGIFLRRWGIEYINAALKSAFEQREKIVDDELILKDEY